LESTDAGEKALQDLFNNDEKAWEAFVRRYSRLVWSSIHKTFISYGFSNSKEDVEDIYGAVFLSLMEDDFRRLRQFNSENACSLSTWLSIVTVRKTIDYIRADKRHLCPDLGEDDGDPAETLPDKRDRADEELEGRQDKELLDRAVAALSVRDKLLYELIFVREVPPEEIAGMMGLTVPTVYSRKHRITARMKKIVGGLQETGSPLV